MYQKALLNEMQCTTTFFDKFCLAMACVVLCPYWPTFQGRVMESRNKRESDNLLLRSPIFVWKVQNWRLFQRSVPLVHRSFETNSRKQGVVTSPTWIRGLYWTVINHKEWFSIVPQMRFLPSTKRSSKQKRRKKDKIFIHGLWNKGYNREVWISSK